MVLVFGEIQTAVLMHSGAAPPALAEQLLALMAGERVCLSEHPIGYATSPDVFAGVDCRVPTVSGARVRAAGTLAGRVSLTGGRVLQGSVVAWMEPGAGGRHRWSHYLTRLGVVETIGRADLTGIGEAHLNPERSSSTMGMGALCGRLIASVQQSRYVDRRPPFAAPRTLLRWCARPGPPPARVRFTIEEHAVRTLRLTLGAEDLAEVVALCEDIALHDWLLTALMSMIERSRIGTGEPAEVVARLRPAVDHLLHLWMPAARLGGAALPVWEGLERRVGFTRQWDASVRRVRDQIAVSGVLLQIRDTRRPPAREQPFLA